MNRGILFKQKGTVEGTFKGVPSFSIGSFTSKRTTDAVDGSSLSWSSKATNPLGTYPQNPRLSARQCGLIDYKD